MRISALLFIIFTFCSCQDAAKKEVSHSSNTNVYAGPDLELVAEHSYTHVISNEGRKPKVGDILSFTQKTYLNDSLLDNPDELGFARINVLPNDTTIQQPFNPTYSVMFRMSEGDSMLVTQPLTKVEKLPQGLTKDDVFTYELKLIKIEDELDALKNFDAALVQDNEVKERINEFNSDYTAGRFDAEFKQTASGIKYIVETQGSGDIAKKGVPAFVNFASYLVDGKAIFSSFLAGSSINFPPGKDKIVPAVDEMVLSQAKGTKLIMIVPPKMAYGKSGKMPNIPDGAEVVIYLEILNYK